MSIYPIMRRNGFTLIELIISVTIFTIIVVTVYSTFYMGIKVWQRGEDDKDLPKLRISLLKIEKELKETFFASDFAFEGTSSEIKFPLSILDGQDEKRLIITYSVKQDGNTGLNQILRTENESLPPKAKVSEEILSPLVKSINFKYAYESAISPGTLEWQDNWSGQQQNKLPSGIRIELDRAGETYSKVVYLQQGELGK